MEQKNGAATASTILGIVSLVIAVIGGITFGVIGAAIALILGIVAVVLGINAKKQTGGTKGQAGFVDGVNLLSESNRQTTPVSCLRFDNCLYYIRFFLFLQSPYMIF